MGIAGKTLFDADTFSEADEIGRALTVALEWTGWAVGRPFSIAHVVAKRAVGKLAARTTGPAHDLLARAEHRLGGPLALVDRRGRELARARPVPGRSRAADDRRSPPIDGGGALRSADAPAPGA